MGTLDLLRVLRARAWWVALGVVLGLLAGALVVLLVPPTYSARISMYVAAQTGDNAKAYEGAQFSQARVVSYVELVTRPRVTKAVIRDLGLDTTPERLAEDITASSEQDSVLLDVTVATNDPALSVAIANAIGQVFPGAVAELEQPLRPGATPPVVVRVVEPADSAEVTSPPWTVPMAFGLLAGLVLGVSLALVRHATDTSVTTGATVREVTGLPLLATTYAERPAGTDGAFVPTRDAPSSPTAEAVRRLRTNLQYVDVDHPPRLLAVMSSVPAEGKTTVACDLAFALATGGSRVLIVEADLRRPAVAERFGLPRTVGLTSVLAGRVGLADAVQPTAAGVDVLTSGPLVPNPGELLGAERTRRLLAELSERYDHVVVDTAPLLTVSDASAVAALVDGVLLICRSGRTPRTKLAQALDGLHAVSARALGVVLTMAPARSAPTDAARYGYSHLPGPATRPSPTPRGPRHEREGTGSHGVSHSVSAVAESRGLVRTPPGPTSAAFRLPPTDRSSP